MPNIALLTPRSAHVTCAGSWIVGRETKFDCTPEIPEMGGGQAAPAFALPPRSGILYMWTGLMALLVKPIMTLGPKTVVECQLQAREQACFVPADQHRLPSTYVHS
jgi:hypothetical protein